MVIQEASERNVLQAPSPLVLFHDGGGTVFSYFLLDSLDRDVLGFSHPGTTSGQHWDSSIVDMATYYYKQMKASMKPGNVILGGKHTCRS